MCSLGTVICGNRSRAGFWRDEVLAPLSSWQPFTTACRRLWIVLTSGYVGEEAFPSGLAFVRKLWRVERGQGGGCTDAHPARVRRRSPLAWHLEQLTAEQGSNPCTPTNKIRYLGAIRKCSASQKTRLGSTWEARGRLFRPARGTVSPSTRRSTARRRPRHPRWTTTNNATAWQSAGQRATNDH